MKISETLKERLILNNESFFSNDNIADYITENERQLLTEEVTQNVEQLLRSLVIDIDNDHNTQDTARRVAKMFIHEIFRGRFYKQPKITSFPNAAHYDEIYVTGPISIRSTCAHHMMPIVGKAYIGVFPGKNVIGLSKFNRITDWIASRPQIQEELTQQVANEVERITQAEGVAVVIKAEHFCMSHRGVKEHCSDMTTSVMRGKFREYSTLKDEFFSILHGMNGFSK